MLQRLGLTALLVGTVLVAGVPAYQGTEGSSNTGAKWATGGHTVGEECTAENRQVVIESLR